MRLHEVVGDDSAVLQVLEDPEAALRPERFGLQFEDVEEDAGLGLLEGVDVVGAVAVVGTDLLLDGRLLAP